jgi:ketosteroid isomerase-like protein
MFLALCDPQIELHSSVTVPGGGSYDGHDGVRRWYRDLAEGWGEELQMEPETYFDLGEQTISFHVLHGRGRQSGANVAMAAAHLCKWRDGLIVYFKGYADRDDMLRELRVSLDELEPIQP